MASLSIGPEEFKYAAALTGGAALFLGGLATSYRKQRDDSQNQVLELQEELHKGVNYDHQTGLLSHRGVVQAYEEKIRHQRKNEQPLFVVYIDLDGFKKINDTEGHSKGDEILANAGSTLARAIRTESGDILGRLHGDEFMALLAGVDGEGAKQAAQRMLYNMREQNVYDRMNPTASIGLLEVATDLAPSFQEISDQSDAAMYAAKRAGGNQIYFAGAEAESIY